MRDEATARPDLPTPLLAVPVRTAPLLAGSSGLLATLPRAFSRRRMSAIAPQVNARLEYMLRIADSSLVLGHRLSEWCGHGPVLEEDIALTNIALDLIGQARSLYAYAGAVEEKGRDEDQFAFQRNEDEFRNVTIVELPNGDYGFTIMRNFLFLTFQRELWAALQGSTESQLSDIARKSLTETRYHVQHASDWVIRLGDGTDESHQRMQRALDTLWPYTAEFFSASTIDRSDVGPAWSTLEGRWSSVVRPILDVATLQVPASTAFLSRGKEGIHSEHLPPLLSEMQYLQRAYPNCDW
jgi:ring-1,2-phenylacetyl-CoA epoxidase subunit PaaC